jgi:hypothetical protein
MQRPAAQTSLEPQPRRVNRQGRKPFLSQNVAEDDGSRLTSEPYRSNARASQHPGSRPRPKQVADYAHLLGAALSADVGASAGLGRRATA